MIRISAFIAASLLATSAFATDPVATLSSQEGTVLVNQGEEFTTANANQALKAGDRVMLMEGASAEITFADGCALPLLAGSLVDIPAVSPCAGGVAKVQNLGPTYAQAPGDRVVRDDGRVMEWIVFGAAGAWILVEVTGDEYSITPPAPLPVSP